MSVRDSYDVVVVGGRVAGSITATLLARSGAQVLVVDRARFPSPTLSTHFFRGGRLIRVLDEAGLLADVEALGAPRLTTQYSYENGAAEGVQEPPQDPGVAGYCMSVRREVLDATLLDGAGRAGAHVLTSSAARGLIHSNGRVEGVELAGGASVRAGLVVGADGRRSMIASEVAAQDRERHSGKRALYYRYVRDFPGPDGGLPMGRSSPCWVTRWPTCSPATTVSPAWRSASTSTSTSGCATIFATGSMPSWSGTAGCGIGTSEANRSEGCSGPARSRTTCSRPPDRGGRSSGTPGCTRTRGAARAWTAPGCRRPCWPRATSRPAGQTVDRTVRASTRRAHARDLSRDSARCGRPGRSQLTSISTLPTAAFSTAACASAAWSRE